MESVPAKTFSVWLPEVHGREDGAPTNLQVSHAMDAEVLSVVLIQRVRSSECFFCLGGW